MLIRASDEREITNMTSLSWLDSSLASLLNTHFGFHKVVQNSPWKTYTALYQPSHNGNTEETGMPC